MFSLQRLLGKEDKFFDLLEASADEARNSVRILLKYLQGPDQLKTLDEFISSRRKEKAITAEIGQALCTNFVTALEREDIESLSDGLYKLTKTVEKIAERLMLAPQFLQGINLSSEITLLERAADIVLEMIRDLRKGVNLERIKALNDQLQEAEGDADKVLLGLLRQLYTSNFEVNRIVFLKDYFELLEKVIDRCRDAGNVVTRIVLKNS
jgi:uncharacterized protein Yka (UPF0111/DUF47 family)